MIYERFREILVEYGFKQWQIDELWETRPYDHLSEARLRETAERSAPREEK